MLCCELEVSGSDDEDGEESGQRERDIDKVAEETGNETENRGKHCPCPS